MTATITEEKIDSKQYTETEKDKVAHYVISPDPKESNHAYVMRARVEGFPVEALCGYTWIPFRLANDLSVCGECEDLSLNYTPGEGDPHE